MHALAVQLAPVLAEKSKVPFYVAGGILVAWALLVGLGLGLRRDDFPANGSQQRIVMAISAVLVLAAVSTAVLTSGGAGKSEAATTQTTPSTAGAPSESGESSASTVTTTSTTSTTGASTGTGTAGTSTPAPAAKAAAPLKVAAAPGGELAYTPKSLSAKAGTVTIAFTNSAPLEHDLTVASGSKVLGATPIFTGGSRSLTLKLPPGTYTFYCSVPGHRAAGMEGTLKVT